MGATHPIGQKPPRRHALPRGSSAMNLKASLSRGLLLLCALLLAARAFAAEPAVVTITTGINPLQPPRKVRVLPPLSILQAFAIAPPANYHEARVLIRAGTCYLLDDQILLARARWRSVENGDQIWVLDPAAFDLFKNQHHTIVRGSDALKALTIPNSSPF